MHFTWPLLVFLSLCALVLAAPVDVRSTDDDPISEGPVPLEYLMIAL